VHVVVSRPAAVLSSGVVQQRPAASSSSSSSFAAVAFSGAMKKNRVQKESFGALFLSAHVHHAAESRQNRGRIAAESR